MFVAGLILGFIILIIGLLKTESDDFDCHPGVWIGMLLGACCIIGCIWNGYKLFQTSYIIDKQIIMYEEENSKIESRIGETVQRYMEYEKDIVYKVSEDDDAFTLITLYPDLKADTLIETEINTYIENNNKIKELRNQQLNKSVYKFMIYFGH